MELKEVVFKKNYFIPYIIKVIEENYKNNIIVKQYAFNFIILKINPILKAQLTELKARLTEDQKKAAKRLAEKGLGPVDFYYKDEMMLRVRDQVRHQILIRNAGGGDDDDDDDFLYYICKIIKTLKIFFKDKKILILFSIIIFASIQAYIHRKALNLTVKKIKQETKKKLEELGLL